MIRKFIKIFYYTTLTALALAILLTSLLVLRRNKEVLPFLEAKLSESIERKITLTAPLDIELSAGQKGSLIVLKLAGLTISNPNPNDIGDFLASKEIQLKIPILQLLRGEFFIEQIDIKGHHSVTSKIRERQSKLAVCRRQEEY